MWMASLTSHLYQSSSYSNALVLVIVTLWPVLGQCFCGSVQFGVLLEPDPQGPLQFFYICMLGITVAGDVVDCATLSFLRGLIVGMIKHGIGRLVIHRTI